VGWWFGGAGDQYESSSSEHKENGKRGREKHVRVEGGGGEKKYRVILMGKVR